VRDFREVLLVEQAQLQRAVVRGQGRDVRGLQRGHPPSALQLAQVFDVQAYELSPLGLIARAVVNGAVGMVVFGTMDRQRRRWAPRA